MPWTTAKEPWLLSANAADASKCFRMISECEGAKWIGRPIEYEDAHMRFLDSPEVLDEAEVGDHASLPPDS